jgi:uncharacterized protein (TIGR02186 family)
MRRAGLLLVTASALCATIAPAHAERLISSLSSHQVLINSSFTGTELVLFGAIERDAATVARRGGYDIIVTVKGPRENLVTRKKERVLGIWTNAESHTFVDTPGYVAVLANRPLDAVMTPELAQKLELGLQNISIKQKISIAQVPTSSNDTFRNAMITLRKEHGLYREETNAVTFLTPNLFRAAIQLPAESPVGNYEVEINLFADGASLTQTSSAFEIVKVGVEQFIASAARDHGVWYGLATTLMALMTGWLASIVFRRD